MHTRLPKAARHTQLGVLNVIKEDNGKCIVVYENRHEKTGRQLAL